MSRSLRTTLPAVLAALALALAGTACNDIGDKASEADAVVLVTAVTTAGTSVASAEDTTATLSLSVKAKSTVAPTSFFNDVTFTNYTVAFSPTGLVPDVTNGIISTGYLPVGSTATLTLVMVPAGSKPAAGTVVVGDAKVEGHDLLGQPLSFDAQVALAFTP